MESVGLNAHIFTNKGGNTLIREFEGVLTNNPSIKNLDAVVGFLRASGYFSLRPFLDNINKARVLVGINVDKYSLEAKRKGLMFLGAPKEVKADCLVQIKQDIEKAGYKKHIEDGILLMVEDLISGKLELRAHPSRSIHAKFYLLYPDGFNQYTQGMLITGSSNLSGNGLGISEDKQQYEFNVKLSQFEDVKFAKDEFEELWEEAKGCEITAEDINSQIVKTYLDDDASPYDLYIKTLMEFFADRVVEAQTTDPYDLPQGYARYEYQTDAVIEGYQMLKRYDGFFLADVVGLGKTIVATMIAKRFLFENGMAKTKILVVYPPAVEQNWKLTFHDFGIDKYTKFISNGSLSKVLDRENVDYWNAEEYDLILVDEAHKFRTHTTEAFGLLQEICKMPRKNKGNIEGRKKVMLISATPMNNSPADIYHQLLLFQDARHCTIDGVPNLTAFFSPLKTEFDNLKRKDSNVKEFQKLANRVRESVIKPITVRRTRTDIESIPRYCKDLTNFPKVEPPKASNYELSPHIANLFEEAMTILTTKLTYARYQAIAYLKPEVSNGLYDNAERISRSLAGIRKNGLVKRLESSFHAFKVSLSSFRQANQNMIDMFDNDKVYIAPDLDINKMLEDKLTEAEIEEKLNKKAEANPKNTTFQATNFSDAFLHMLRADQQLLDQMCEEWAEVGYNDDSKFAKFQELLKHELFSKKINDEGKLVIFSESIDTVNYLQKRIARDDLIVVTSQNRNEKFKTICENFDANYHTQRNDYNILLTTDVLSEGVNLHRANVIVNYDTPWNSTRLMQRIGRVNRIGGKADHIYNYVFYPSREGNREINLKEIALSKIQTFHSTFGEDNKVFSENEVIDRNLDHLFNEAIGKENEEKNQELPFYEELLDLYKNHRNEYERIAKLPPRSRTGRNSRTVDGVTLCGDTLVFLKVNNRRKFFLVSETVKNIDEVDALAYFKASKDEPRAERIPQHHDHVNLALSELDKMTQKEAQEQENLQDGLTGNRAGVQITTALSLLESCIHGLDNDDRDRVRKLKKLVDKGTITSIPLELRRIRNSLNKKHISWDEALDRIKRMAIEYEPYYTEEENTQQTEPANAEIILSESFTQQ
ncbi:MAG: phospholipase D-like domain-containing protein [Prevotellaceae bacterium]|nr:phospholipase D-like domain-containing protein [Prevotellaceae bacterium]